MAPGSITLAIIAFWAAMTAWVLYNELWPRWQSDNPPPFAIDLTDEAQPNGPNHIMWNVVINGKQGIFHLETWVKYRPKEDLFELHSEMWPKINIDGDAESFPQLGQTSQVLAASGRGKARSYLPFILTCSPPPPAHELHNLL